MANYTIVTDSTCDITQKMADELNLKIVSLCYIMGGKTYVSTLDSKELPIAEFYEKIRAGETSTTAQVNTETFIRCFEPILEQGEDILYIAFSSGLSGTCQSGMIAKNELQDKYPDRKIIVFDSLCASMGEGLLVYHAAKLKEKGASIDEVHEWLKENSLKLIHLFTVEDLNHLKRGGRVSAGAALLGTMLSIKPVLRVDNEGHLVPLSKVRGRKQSLDALVSRMEEIVVKPAEQIVFISHSDCIGDAKYVEKEVKARLNVKKVFINYIGPVIGSHTGSGTVALFFFGTTR